MIIRDAVESEFSFIREQRVQSYEEHALKIPEAHWEALRQAISSEADLQPGVDRIVAVVDGEIVGSVALFPAKMDAYNGLVDEQDYPEIRMLAVSPMARGRGVASGLIKECIQRSKDKGFQAIGLHTGEFMHSAMKLYEYFGFERMPQFDFEPAGDGIIVKAYWLSLSKVHKEWEIKQLTPNDASQYWSLRLEALKNNPEAFLTSYEDALKRENPIEQVALNFSEEGNFTFGAFENQKLIGMVTLLQEKPQKIKHRANLFAMYVTPKKQGLGIGEALLTEAINKAKTIESIEKINLSVTASNEKAKRLYMKLGFKVYGTEERALKINDVYYDEEHMVLKLR